MDILQEKYMYIYIYDLQGTYDSRSGVLLVMIQSRPLSGNPVGTKGEGAPSRHQTLLLALAWRKIGGGVWDPFADAPNPARPSPSLPPSLSC